MTHGPNDTSNEPTSADPRARLRNKSHIDDDELIDALLAAGITGKRFAAFELVPCLAVAWATDTPNGKQRAAIHALANARGLAADSPAAAQIDEWLARAPGPALFELWCRWVDAAAAHGGHPLRRLRRELLETLPQIAKASAQGLVGARVGHTQALLLKRTKHAFDRLSAD